MDTTRDRAEAAERRRQRRTQEAGRRAVRRPRSVMDLDPSLLEAAATHLNDFLHDYVSHKDGSWNGHNEEIVAQAAAYLEVCRAARFVREAHAARGPTAADVRRARRVVERAASVAAGQVPAPAGEPQCPVCGGAVHPFWKKPAHDHCVRSLASAKAVLAKVET